MYTIWLCCGEFEQEETREDALSMAASLMNGDNHQVLAVEGPDGEDLIAAVEELSNQRSREWLEQSKKRPPPIGRVEVKGPKGKWWGRIYVYSEPQRDRELSEMRQVYGDDRVQFVAQ